MPVIQVWPLVAGVARQDGAPFVAGDFVEATPYVWRKLNMGELSRSDPGGPPPELPRDLSGVRSIASGQWVTAPTICRLSISGTGTLRVDGRSRSGAVTQGLAQGRYVSASGAMQVVYADAAVEIRAVITGALTVEVLA